MAASAVEVGVGADAAGVVSLDFGFFAGVEASGSGSVASGSITAGSVTAGSVTSGLVASGLLPDVPVLVWALTTTPSATVSDVVLELDGFSSVDAGVLVVGVSAELLGVSGLDVGSVACVAEVADDSAELDELLAEFDELEVDEPVEVSSATAMP